jgi:HEAT repeat protein
MWVFAAIGLFTCALAWRITGSWFLGRTLVKALSSKNENLCHIAGILLVRAGRKAEPVLEEALHKGQNLPTVLTILADIGDKRVEPEIRDFSRHEDPRVAEAAKQALRILAMQR